MEKQELDNIIYLLISIIQVNENKTALINEFQDKIWNMNDSSSEYKILSELANDLDYYEPDSEIRAEESSYYCDDKLLKEIKSTITRLLPSNLENHLKEESQALNFEFFKNTKMKMSIGVR